MFRWNPYGVSKNTIWQVEYTNIPSYRILAKCLRSAGATIRSQFMVDETFLCLVFLVPPKINVCFTETGFVTGINADSLVSMGMSEYITFRNSGNFFLSKKVGIRSCD